MMTKKKETQENKDKQEEMFEDTKEQEQLYQEEKPKKKTRHPFTHFILLLTLLSSLLSLGLSFYYQKKIGLSLLDIVEQLLLVLFTILFVLFTISTKRKKKGLILLGSFFLLLYYAANILFVLPISLPYLLTGIPNFQGKSITEVIAYAEQNNLSLKQVYEYSDIVSEYHVINQDTSSITNLAKIKSLTVAISEGPSPYKEVVIPDMTSWDVERVLAFIQENNLSNVKVEFIASDKAVDTVISQNKTGSMARNEEFKLTFSYGEERTNKQVKLIDLTNKSKLEALFYLEQNGISYEFKEDFSKKIKKGNVMAQSKKAGTTIKIEEDKIEVTISKGTKINVPDLKQMNLTEITNWVIENQLKLELTEKYDEKIKKNKVIEANYQKGDSVATGTIIKVTYSKGSITMPKFNSFEEFMTWANEHNIPYEEKHEFSTTVPAGEVISYSYKKGQTIKNNDTIIVTISDGEEIKVPDLIGLSKADAESKLKKLGLNYNFIYKASNSVAKDKVLAQSITEGSGVSKGTTITVTLSNGKKETSSTSKKSSSSSSSSNQTQTTPAAPSCDASKKTTVYIYDELVSSGNANTTCSKIKTAYPNLKFSCTYQSGTGISAGLLLNSNEIDGREFNACETITLRIAQN